MQSCEEWCVCICRRHTFSRTGQNTWVCLNAITVIDDSPSCHPTVSLLSVFLHVPVSLLHTQEHSAEKGVELNIYLLIRTYVQTLLPPPRWFWPLTVDVRQTEACHFVFTVPANLICDSLYRTFSSSVEDACLLSKWWFSDRLMLCWIGRILHRQSTYRQITMEQTL